MMIAVAESIKENGFPKSEKDFANRLVDTEVTVLSKKNKKRNFNNHGSGITLTNDKIKYIMKVIRSLENREI